MTPALRLTGVSFSYPHHAAVENASAEIPAGKLTVLFGRNGSGKSTLLRLCGKLLDGYGGEIECLGTELRQWERGAFARSVGYLGQFHTPVFPFRVEEVILTGRAGHVRFLPVRADHDAVESVIDELGIGALRGRVYSELSGGEQQLVLLARALVNRPALLLLDEPTNHLDFANQSRILTEARALVRRGITIICALHDPNMAFQFGDEVHFVHRGSLVRAASERPWESAVFREMVPSFTTVTDGARTVIVPE